MAVYTITNASAGDISSHDITIPRYGSITVNSLTPNMLNMVHLGQITISPTIAVTTELIPYLSDLSGGTAAGNMVSSGASGTASTGALNNNFATIAAQFTVLQNAINALNAEVFDAPTN